MPASHVDHLILGGGAAAASAAFTLRLADPECSIRILSADDTPPYYRPALSKQYLLGTSSEEQILLHPADLYADQRIDLTLGAEVVGVDASRQTVIVRDGSEVAYEKLLIATGAGPRRLSLPGADLTGVHHLRSKAECLELRREIAGGARKAVVLGASFLGMEAAMTLLELGIGVTIIEIQPHVLYHLESPQASDFFEAHARDKGAEFLLDDTVTAIHGDDRVSAIETRSGQRIPCDILLVSIGSTAATQFLDHSGITVQQGLIVVDDQLHTNVADVFAAGDVTSFFDPVFDRRRHIEHWDNAVKQGRLAARNMIGQRLRYDEVSYFYCDIGDVSFSMLGAPDEGREQIARGSLEERSVALFYLRDDVPRALFSIRRPTEETRNVEGLIRYRVNLADEKKHLPDPDFTFDKIPTQTVLVLQGGGAMGAFECGVVKALEEEAVYPDVVAGISIGALNGAIVASNPRHATPALESFWYELSVASPALFGEEMARTLTSMQILTLGVPEFFRPRWLPSPGAPLTLPNSWTSYYDVAPMRRLITKYVDFAKLKSSPVRLLVGAVNVSTGQLEVFDSYVDDLTPDHLLASGSLPPGFPWTEIDGQAYWDGGVVTNSPLDIVIDRCGPNGKRVFVVDLFVGQRALPRNMMEVMARRDEIVYSERIRNDFRLREATGAYRNLIKRILDFVDPPTQCKIRQRPQFIELMGDGGSTTITRFVRPSRDGEPSSRDYDFSDISIRSNQEQGYALVKQTFAKLIDAPGEPPVGAAMQTSDLVAP